MAFYRELNHERNKVRMLTIVDPPDGIDSSLVHCQLEHVSLEDLTPEFAQFLSEGNKPCDYTALRDWLKKFHPRDGYDYPFPNSKVQLGLPLWRWKVEYGSEAEGLEEWDEIMEALEMDFSKCPKIPKQARLKCLMRMDQPLELRTPIKFQNCFLEPRFQWGDFEAISYCWESDIRDQKIVVNNTVFEVPKNLEALLQRLRSLPDSKSGMKFWVDALSIDQSNVAERNHQVKLMKSIYTKAFAVIVRLGDGTDESDKAIDFTASITHFSVSEERDEQFDFENWGNQSSPTDQRKIFSELPWKPLLSFFTRNYWRRLWIIQELALNHNMTLFLCGDRQLSRSMIWRTCEFCKQHIGVIDRLFSPNLDSDFKNVSPSSMYGSIWPTIYHINELVSTREKWIEGNLDGVLDLGRKANVTDARDKIYGLLGLLPSTLSTKISPNYAKPNTKMDVYQEFARTMVNESQRLDSILSWCSYEKNSLLPSWIPDWMSKFPRNHIYRLKQRKASGSSIPANWSFSNEGRLHVKGFIIDSIHNNIQYHRRYSNKEQLSAAIRRTLTMDHPRTHENKKTILDIPWIDWEKLKTIDQDNRRLKIFWHGMHNITKNLCWETFDQFRQTNADFSICGQRFRDFFPDMRISDNPNFQFEDLGLDSMDPYEQDLTNDTASDMLISVLALIGRRLIITKGGNLGLVPEEVEKDDFVAVLYGCNFPVLLRRDGDSECYSVIGECYVDGIMDGEVIEAKERGEYKEIDICLC